ncbi:MAG: hypothetical protein SOY63_02130, partial [Alloprevotella sp.]|nr:hypothetical protein [Alloprevotella sp.]
EHAHQHKGQAHGGFFVSHILVFYEVYQALGFATTAKRWRKITKKSQKLKETKRQREFCGLEKPCKGVTYQPRSKAWVNDIRYNSGRTKPLAALVRSDYLSTPKSV